MMNEADKQKYEKWCMANKNYTQEAAFEAALEYARGAQEPVFWYRPRSDGGNEGPIHNLSMEGVRKKSGAWKPLFEGAPANEVVRGLVEALKEMIEMTEEPPPPNCSCHLHPPCGDCVHYSGLRGALNMGKKALAAYKEPTK